VVFAAALHVEFYLHSLYETAAAGRPVVEASDEVLASIS